MDIVTFFPFLRVPGEFTEAESSGSLAVHHDLLHWALLTGTIRRGWILPDRMNVFGREQPVERMYRALESFPEEVRNRTAIISALALIQNETSEKSFLALGKSSEILELMALRNHMRSPTAVCGLVHSCLFPGTITTYCGALLNARDGDVLCVTSTAAMQATCALLDQAQDYLDHQLGAVTKHLRERLRLVLTPLALGDDWVYPVDRGYARDILGLPQDSLVVLYFGRISREYKADLAPLLLAFHQLRKSHPRAQLIIAGSDIHAGPDEHLRAQVHQLGIFESTQIRRNVAPPLKRLLFAAADFFASPSDNVVESFGLSILEAMGAGLPVIASDWSGYRDLIDHEVTGFLVRTTICDSVWSEASALAEFAVTPHAEYYLARQTWLDSCDLVARMELLACDRELRLRMGDAARRRVAQQYVWSKAIQKFAGVWAESIIAASKSCSSPVPTLDLEGIFGRYSSSRLYPSDPQFLTASPLADEELLSRIPMDQETRRLLTSCRERPMLLPILWRSGAEVRDRVCWLLKQGLVRLSRVPVPDQL
ncbi:MAG: glycosyltransferase family 4 protein [Bryobacteraceae bacterium]